MCGWMLGVKFVIGKGCVGVCRGVFVGMALSLF